MCIHGVCSSYPDILQCVVFARAMSGSLTKLLNLCIRNIERVLNNTFYAHHYNDIFPYL